MKYVDGTNLSKKNRASSQEDRAWSKTIAEVEKLGRSRSNTLVTKSTSDTVGAIAVGVMTIMERLFPPGTVPSVRKDAKKYIRVPDAKTIEVFLKQARKVYRKTHSHTPRRGRPTEEINAFTTLLKLSSETEGALTQVEMVRKLMEGNLSKNTAYRYAKLYYLSLRRSHGRAPFTDAERQWFAKNKMIMPALTLYGMRVLYLHQKRPLEEMGGSELF